MSKSILHLKFIFTPYSFFSWKVLTPSMKLRFYTEHHPEKVEWAKDVFLWEVSHAILFLTPPFSDIIIVKAISITEFSDTTSHQCWFNSATGDTCLTTSMLAFGFWFNHTGYPPTHNISKSMRGVKLGRWSWVIFARFANWNQYDPVLAGKEPWLWFLSITANTIVTGKSTTLPDALFSSIRLFTYPRVSCALWARFFISEGDHEHSTKPHQPWPNGTSANAEVLG